MLGQLKKGHLLLYSIDCMGLIIKGGLQYNRGRLTFFSLAYRKV